MQNSGRMVKQDSSTKRHCKAKPGVKATQSLGEDERELIKLPPED